MKLIEDLRTAARFLLDDGFDIETDEAIRIGIVLAELAGKVQQASYNEKEQGTNA